MYRTTARAATSEPLPTDWHPPQLRRVVTITDYDGPEPVTRTITMERTDRIDTYAVRFGNAPARHIGWSETLRLLRKSLPRVSVRRMHG